VLITGEQSGAAKGSLSKQQQLTYFSTPYGVEGICYAGVESSLFTYCLLGHLSAQECVTPIRQGEDVLDS